MARSRKPAGNLTPPAESEGANRQSKHRRVFEHLLASIDRTPLAAAELLDPVDGKPHARFLAFRSPDAQRWYEALKGWHCITDARGDVLRIGFGIYQDEGDVDRLVDLLGRL